jgi:hypothetical protein
MRKMLSPAMMLIKPALLSHRELAALFKSGRCMAMNNLKQKGRALESPPLLEAGLLRRG